LQWWLRTSHGESALGNMSGYVGGHLYMRSCISEAIQSRLCLHRRRRFGTSEQGSHGSKRSGWEWTFKNAGDAVYRPSARGICFWLCCGLFTSQSYAVLYGGFRCITIASRTRRVNRGTRSVPFPQGWLGRWCFTRKRMSTCRRWSSGRG
jgi:hypothetical protein